MLSALTKKLNKMYNLFHNDTLDIISILYIVNLEKPSLDRLKKKLLILPVSPELNLP